MMNNPNYNQTLTVFRKINGAWEKTVLHNCFFKSEIIKTQEGTDARQVNTYTARVPLSAAGEGFKVSVDDIVVKGECADKITGEAPNTAAQILLKNKPDAFKVTAFSDNTSHRVGKHYRLGG